MINFLLGISAGFFLCMLLLQLFTKKTIHFGGLIDKAENPKRYWVFAGTYFGGFIAMINLYFYYQL